MGGAGVYVISTIAHSCQQTSATAASSGTADAEGDASKVDTKQTERATICNASASVDTVNVLHRQQV
jgi:xanthine dehydrogenase molybdopterin-binding subunit B